VVQIFPSPSNYLLYLWCYKPSHFCRDWGSISSKHHHLVIDCSESEVIRRNQFVEIVEHNNLAIIESEPTISIIEVIALKPSVRTLNTRNMRTLVHEMQNILKVKEELVVIGGIVGPTSRWNKVGALAHRLVRNKHCLCCFLQWEACCWWERPQVRSRWLLCW